VSDDGDDDDVAVILVCKSSERNLNLFMGCISDCKDSFWLLFASTGIAWISVDKPDEREGFSYNQ
jgi:hypothetical protein